MSPNPYASPAAEETQRPRTHPLYRHAGIAVVANTISNICLGLVLAMIAADAGAGRPPWAAAWAVLVLLPVAWLGSVELIRGLRRELE